MAELTPDSFRGIDLALFSAGTPVAREFAPIARDAGAIVIDNSSTFRMEPDVPLVIPEINGDDVETPPRNHRQSKLHYRSRTDGDLSAASGFQRAIVFSPRVIRQFLAAARARLPSWRTKFARCRKSAGTAQKFIRILLPLMFSRMSTHFSTSGYTKEEMKMQNEGRRIMHHPEFRASVTCVRVPVYRAHSVAVSAEFSEPISVERAREILAKAPGLELVDEPARNRYPMPIDVAGKDNCEVGRVRRDCAFENGLAFWVSGDQLLKGAALNAVQIAELL